METETAISLSTALSLFAGKPISQTATPTTGQTVIVTQGSSDVNLWLSPAGTLATLTVQLPVDGVSTVGQTVSIGSSQAITLLSVTGASALFNIANTLSAGDFVELRKVASNTWSQIK